MRKSSQALCLAVIVLGTFSSVLPARSAEALRLTLGIAKSVVVEGATAGNFSSIIGDPKIADVTFGPKNTLWFIGLAEGTTNIIMLDNSTGREMYSAIIVVGDTNRVHIHNKKVLTSYTVYRCDPICVYVDEVTAKEPAPLPIGHSQSSGTIETVAPPASPPGAP